MWGLYAWVSEYGSSGEKSGPLNKGEGMQKLIDKYGFHHSKTKYVRDTEIAARILESSVGPEIKKYFPDYNDGYLLNALRKIVRTEIKPYEMDCTHLSEGCAQEITQNLTGISTDALCQKIELELKEINDPFGLNNLKLTRG